MAQTVTTLTDADNGRMLDIHAGDILVIRLHENAAAGYRWAVDNLDSALIDDKGVDYVSKSSAVGSPVEVQWRLEAKAPGSTHLSLKLWRQWEGDSSIQKRFGIALTIR